MPLPVRRALALASLVVLTPEVAHPAALGQALVLQKGNGREFHNAWCPLVRDGKDVLALNRAQAAGRGLTPHAECAQDTGGDAKPPAAPVFVHVDQSKYYHRAACARLARTSERQALATAAKTRWPCPVCRPPIRKSGS